MKRLWTFLALFACLGLGSALAQQVTITYWQYDFATRIEAMNQLIAQFEAENPDIRVVHETFPYDAYQQQVAASLPAGQGADVVQLFYGWLATWARAGYLEPLPEAYFDTETIEAEFIPMVEAAKLGGVYYGLPTAVRSLALFYNRDKLEAAGYSEPPATWSEFIEVAQALTERRGPRFTQIGYGVAPAGQDHHLIREVLTRQFGTQPYSDDLRQVLYGDEAGLEAFKFYTSWVTEHEIGVPEFVPGANGYRDGFRQQENIAMIIDGSFAIGAVANEAQFNWGVAELPTLDNGVRANFGSFWMNGLTPNAYRDPARLEASAKFLAFITRPEAMRLWLEVVGELPARQELLNDPELLEDPINGPFIASLAYATATPFVDEAAQRSVILDAVNRVLLEGMDPEESWRIAVQEDQALLDEFNR
jgi:multiple sugar transport system substrate-binding protein